MSVMADLANQIESRITAYFASPVMHCGYVYLQHMFCKQLSKVLSVRLTNHEKAV